MSLQPRENVSVCVSKMWMPNQTRSGWSRKGKHDGTIQIQNALAAKRPTRHPRAFCGRNRLHPRYGGCLQGSGHPQNKEISGVGGKTLVNFFVEPSTRTRTSFEIAAIRLSADVINISASSSSLVKGETLKDTTKILEAYHADLIVIRNSSSGAPQFLARHVKSDRKSVV